MPVLKSQTGAIPFIALAIGVPILLGICFFIIFSTGGITGGSSNATPIPTQRPEPTFTPKPKSASTFVKVDQTIDLENIRTIYCDSEHAENVQYESNQFRAQLKKSATCLDNYDQYEASQSAKLKKCNSDCDTVAKKETKECQDLFDTQQYGEYDLYNCNNDATTKQTSCHDSCNTQERVLTVAEYNVNCRTPSVDQSFRLNDAIRQYCQDHP